MGKGARDEATVGWREWVALPGLGISAIKAKVDTGARSSSLHACGIEAFEREGEPWVRFRVHPFQRSASPEIEVETPLLEVRRVTTSSGHSGLRPVIRTELELLGDRWPIELTLARRDAMGFRMLLGREALRGRFVVDPGGSYYNGRPSRRALRAGLRAEEEEA